MAHRALDADANGSGGPSPQSDGLSSPPANQYPSPRGRRATLVLPGASALLAADPPPQEGSPHIESSEAGKIAADSQKAPPPNQASGPEPSPQSTKEEFSAENSAALGIQPPSLETPTESFAEFEQGELLGEGTAIESTQCPASPPQFTQDSIPSITLIIESGNEKGQEFFFQRHLGSVITIGRALDNNIVLTDLGVSRHHLQIQLGEEGITAVDLRSANGTFVNDSRIERVFLADGDRIRIGKTTFRVRLGGEGEALQGAATVASPFEFTQERSPPSDKEVLAPLDSPHPPPIPSALYQAPESTPPSGAIVVRASWLMASVSALVLLASAVGAGFMALVLHRSAKPQASPVSHPAPNRQVRSAEARGMKGQTLSPQPLPPITPSLSPQAPEFASSSQPTPAPPNSLKPGKAEEKPPSSQVPLEASTSSPSSSSHAALSSPDPRIFTAYRRRAFEEAVQLARNQASSSSGRQRVQLEQLARNIETFAKRYVEAQRGNFSSLMEAYRLDKRIGNGRGAFEAELLPRLINGYLQRARSMMAKEPSDACNDVRAALELQPRHSEALALWRSCEQKGQELFNQARHLERSDPMRARILYGDVISIMGPSHSLSKEATLRLKSLSQASTLTRPRRIIDEDQ
ncbi:MAG: FHA domain-containing protein [Sandaracinaceae bacterium]|nr:FHA domain-containing protein [Sandaracinaceae bacterium]